MTNNLSALYRLPTGRQLHRTPPSQSCVRTLHFQEEDYSDRRESFNTPPIRLDTSSAPESMTKGMKDYEMKPEDLQFMQRLKLEKEIKRLQDECAALTAEIRRETMALELTSDTLAKIQDQLEEYPSQEQIRKMAVEFLMKSLPSCKKLSTRAQLALISRPDLSRAIDDQHEKIEQLEAMVRDRREECARRGRKQEPLLAAEQSKILELMATLAELKSALAQQQKINESLEGDKAPDVAARFKKSATKSEGRTTVKTPSAKPKLEDSGNRTKTKKRNPPKSADKAKQAEKTKSDPAPSSKTQVKDPRVKSGKKGRESPAVTAPKRQGSGPGHSEAAPASTRRKPEAQAAPPNDQGPRRSKRIAARQ